MIESFEGPPFRHAAEVHSGPYRREPYAHAILPGGRRIDGKVCRWSTMHERVHWQDVLGGAHREA